MDNKIKLKDFQKECLKKLFELSYNDDNMQNPKEILLKSPTGSGKTIIMIHYINQYLSDNSNAVAIWLTPGNADLEVQSKDKMDKYIKGRTTKLLKNVIEDGFERGDTCFINWESVTRKGNNAIDETEKNNLYQRIKEAHCDGIEFLVIVDEQHSNQTALADDLRKRFKPVLSIGISATIKEKEGKGFCEIKESDVIAEKLITKFVAINENVEDEKKIDKPTNYLIDLALNKQNEIYQAFLKQNLDIMPLILIQLKNKNEEEYEEIYKYLLKKIRKEEIGIRLDKVKENIRDIENNDSKIKVMIMKQATSIGWDCPRAKILVKMREKMNDIFTIQTIGRIRRSINATHYSDDILNTSFLYTYDKDFTNDVTKLFEESTKNKKIVYLKDEFQSFEIPKETKKEIYDTRINKEDIELFNRFFSNKYHLTKNNYEKNKVLLSQKYVFSSDVLFKTKKGVSTTTNELSKNLKDIEVKINAKERNMERELNLAILEIGAKSGILDRTRLKTLLKYLFLNKILNKYSILKMNRTDFTAFIINNKAILKEDVFEAVKSRYRQLELNERNINNGLFSFPLKNIITVLDEKTYKKQTNSNITFMKKNVYNCFPSNVDLSTPEAMFLEYAEKSNKIKWIYKNGENDSQYFSILYLDNDKKYNTFYPDFILKDVYNQIWIIETKGGENVDESTRNIDKILTPIKYSTLQRFCKKNNYKYAFVRDKILKGKLPILKILYDTDIYYDKLEDEHWKDISDIL